MTEHFALECTQGNKQVKKTNEHINKKLRTSWQGRWVIWGRDDVYKQMKMQGCRWDDDMDRTIRMWWGWHSWDADKDVDKDNNKMTGKLRYSNEDEMTWRRQQGQAYEQAKTNKQAHNTDMCMSLEASWWLWSPMFSPASLRWMGWDTWMGPFGLGPSWNQPFFTCSFELQALVQTRSFMNMIFNVLPALQGWMGWDTWMGPFGLDLSWNHTSCFALHS